MLFVRSWLEKYINLAGISNAQIAEAITLKSSEVEEITEITDWFGGKVLVGKIQNVRPHPDADRLKVFDVDLGNRSVQIVSAAPNVVDGLIVPVALEGAVLPGLTITPKPMRGQKSEGMCCGKSELLQETGYSSGLWELNDFDEIESKLGMSICEALPEFFAPQTVFEIKVLPDKIGTIGNHLGMSLELANCLNNPNLLRYTAKEISQNSTNWKEKVLSAINKKNPISSSKFKISVEDKSKYSNVFCLFQIDTKTPFYLPNTALQQMFFAQKNLIGGLADLSNYILHDLGQPNHFFDTQKLQNIAQNNDDQNNLHWVISKTADQTNFTGLGQLKKTIIPANVDVLTCNDEILSIPAISGSESTKMEEKTTQAVIEFANFDAAKVARNSFALNYRSDGAKIWAGSVNAKQIVLGLLELLNNLPEETEFSCITNLLNSEINTSFEYTLSALFDPKIQTENEAENHSSSDSSQDILQINYDYLVSRLDGQNAEEWKPKIEAVLKLSGKIKDGFYYKNSFYSSIHTQEDILHEVSKHVGYDAFKKQYIQTSSQQSRNTFFDDILNCKKVFGQYGFTEVITRPFISKEEVDLIYEKTESDNLLTLLNPHNSNEPHIRPGLLPHLIKTLAQNVKSGYKNPRLFEVNKTYLLNQKNPQKHPQEKILLEAVMLEQDPYTFTSCLQELLGNLYPEQKLEIANLTPKKLGNCVVYSLNNKVVAELFEVKNAIKKSAEIPLQKRLWAVSMDITNLPNNTHFFAHYIDQSDFPPLKRSYSLIVQKTQTWQNIKPLFEFKEIVQTKIIVSARERFAHNDENDVLNIDLKLTSPTRTLSNQEADEWFEITLQNLNNFGIELRNT